MRMLVVLQIAAQIWQQATADRPVPACKDPG